MHFCLTWTVFPEGPQSKAENTISISRRFYVESAYRSFSKSPFFSDFTSSRAGWKTKQQNMFLRESAVWTLGLFCVNPYPHKPDRDDWSHISSLATTLSTEPHVNPFIRFSNILFTVGRVEHGATDWLQMVRVIWCNCSEGETFEEPVCVVTETMMIRLHSLVNCD